MVTGRGRVVIAPLANLLSRAYGAVWLCAWAHAITMRKIDTFQRDYSLAVDLTHGQRSAAYLNWRFLDDPGTTYACWEFADATGPIGYCVYARVHATADLFDFVACRRRRACMRLLVDHCRGTGIARLSFTGVGLQMRSFGFVRRNGQVDCTMRDLPDGQWLLTRCDIEPGVEPGA